MNQDPYLVSIRIPGHEGFDLTDAWLEEAKQALLRRMDCPHIRKLNLRGHEIPMHSIRFVKEWLEANTPLGPADIHQVKLRMERNNAVA